MTTLIVPNRSQERRDKAFIGSAEELQSGIWPRSIPLWMAVFYVALFIIRPWEMLFPWLGKIHFERIYAGLMIVTVFLGRRKRFQMTFQSFAVLLFFGAIGLSGYFAEKPSLAWDPFYQYLGFVTFFFILLFVIRSSYELVFMVACYIATMTVYLAKAQWEFILNGRHRYTMGVTRLIGIEDTFGGPNSLAMSIVVSLPMLLFLWSVRKEFTAEWPVFWRKSFSPALFAYFFLAVSSIVLTNSRSGMAGLVFFVVLVSFKGGLARKIGGVLVGAALLSMLWYLIPGENRERFRTIWDPSAGPEDAQVSASGRIEGYRAGIEIFKRFPITGVGIGNFVEYRSKSVDGVALNAHHLVGQVLGETGLVGGVTFLLMVIAILVNCRRVRVLVRGRPDPTLSVLQGLAIALRDAVLLLAFEGAFGHNLLRFNWLWLAAFGVLAREYAETYLRNLEGLVTPR